MTIREAEGFIASVPWRAVKMVEVGDTGKTPDPHEYVIKGWREVDTNSFDAFVRLIKATGYRARYRAPYRPDDVMTNHYLEINGWSYWFIHPNMLNRERAEHRKHKPMVIREARLRDRPLATPTPDEHHERRLLVGERFHRRVDAAELLRVVDTDASFRRHASLARLNERPASRGKRASRLWGPSTRGPTQQHCAAQLERT